MGKPINNCVSRCALAEHFISAAVPGFKSQFLFHLLSRACHGVDCGKCRNLAELGSIILRVSINRTHEHIGHQNCCLPVRPFSQGEFPIRKFVFFIAFGAIAAGKPERIRFKPQFLRQAYRNG